MGRGRAKAKATKVARELKYTPIGGDLTALQAELHAERDDSGRTDQSEADDAERGGESG
jgi:hypothetical protein